MNKKGSLLDIIPAIVVVVAIGISVLFASLILNKFDENYKGERPKGFNETIKKGHSAIGIFDYGIVIVLGGVMVGILILAYMIPSHPALFAVSFLVISLVILVSALFSNLWIEIAESSVFSSITNTFPIMYYVIKNLPFLILGYSILLVIAMYSGGGGAERRI